MCMIKKSRQALDAGVPANYLPSVIEYDLFGLNSSSGQMSSGEWVGTMQNRVRELVRCGVSSGLLEELRAESDRKV